MKPELPPEDFAGIVRHAPLVSIDLIVRDTQGRVLLGRRGNPPARGWWFVPGGRIRKDESLAAATSRLLADELGWTGPAPTRLRGVFEHFHTDNFLGTHEFSTHYVVLAYEVDVGAVHLEPPLLQHSEYRWWDVPEILTSPSVHRYTQAFFEPAAGA